MLTNSRYVEDQRLRKIPFTVRRPTKSEIERVRDELCTVQFFKRDKVEAAPAKPAAPAAGKVEERAAPVRAEPLSKQDRLRLRVFLAIDKDRVRLLCAPVEKRTC